MALNSYIPTLSLQLSADDTTTKIDQLLRTSADRLIDSLKLRQKLITECITTVYELSDQSDPPELVVQNGSVRFFYTLHPHSGFGDVEEAAQRLLKTAERLGYIDRYHLFAMGRPSGKVPAVITTICLTDEYKLPYTIILEGEVRGDSKVLTYHVTDYSSNQPMWTIYKR